jgi:hypothetical protein
LQALNILISAYENRNVSEQGNIKVFI